MSKKALKKMNPVIKQRLREVMEEEDAKEEAPPIEQCWVVAENRLGMFSVTTGVLNYAEWEVFQEVMKNFMITQATVSPDKKSIRYVAFSPLFDKISPLEPDMDGPKVPFYQITVNIDKDTKKVEVTAEIIEESKIIGAKQDSKILDRRGKPISHEK